MSQRKLKIDVVLGSKSDLPQAKTALEYLAPRVELSVHIISCHRNPLTLMRYAHGCTADIVIAAAGMAAALPGELNAWLVYFRKKDISVVGVALAGKDELDNLAAKLSIERLPGNPVLLALPQKAYFGREGFVSAAWMVTCFEIHDAERKKPSEAEQALLFAHFPKEEPPQGKEAILNWDWRSA